MTAGRTDRTRPSPPSPPRAPAPRGDTAPSGALRQSARRTLLRTSDGVAIDALYEPGATLAPGVAVALGRGAARSAVDGPASREHAGSRGGDGPLAEGEPAGERATDEEGTAGDTPPLPRAGVGGAPPHALEGSGEALEGAGDGVTGAAARPVIVLAHGFTGDLERPHVRRIARILARRAAVVTFSFRGHGRSGGHSTVGDREVLDLAAAVDWARRLGNQRVITVGFSMGGSVVLRHAALQDGPAGGTATPREVGEISTSRENDDSLAAVVSVSAPARWYYRGTAPMRRLHWLVTRPEGRVVSRYGLRTRIHHREWDPVPLSPTESVPLIAPTPLLIVHGDRDPYFPLDHPRMLAAASGGSAEFWVERGMGHAEHATDDALVTRIADWAAGHAG